MANEQPPMQCEFQFYDKDNDIRIDIPITAEKASQIMKAVGNGNYTGSYKLWVTAGTAFKTETERDEFYKNNPGN